MNRGTSLALRTGLAVALAVGHPHAQAQAQDASFLSGEELAAQLRQDLVWIGAIDIGEHGYGMVVGGDADTLWVATARHVVVSVPMRGDTAPERPSQDIRVRLCASTSGEPLSARPVGGFDAGGQDVALLAVPRPGGFQLDARALAEGAEVGEAVWLLGGSEECAALPSTGHVRSVPGAEARLRIDFPGVQGGSSGGAVLSGRGIMGLVLSAEDLTASVNPIGDLRQRVQATPGARWDLVAARNIPPTDPHAAEVDLAETLNQYQLALQDMHMLLQQPQVARVTLDDFMKRYNAALTRFLRVRDTYDGSLARNWPAAVLSEWRALRETVWNVHQAFWRINAQMEDVYRHQRSTPELRARMSALDPELQKLESDIARFLRLLSRES